MQEKMASDLASDRPQPRQAPPQSGEHFSLLAEHVQDNLWRYDMVSQRLVYCSPSVRQMLKYTPAEILELSLADFVSPPCLDRLTALLRGSAEQTADADRAVHRMELELIRKDGERIWAEISATVVRDPAGHARELFGVTRDITERKQAEEEMHKARELAEQASRLKSQLVSAVSHELRTPVNGIIGFAELLQRERSPERIQELAQVILSESRMLLSIVDDLLDHAKLEAGKLTLELEEVNLDEWLLQLGRFASVQAERKGIAFSLKRAEGTPRWVRIDPLRLRQILSNLLANAIKFTDQGGVCLSVEPAASSGEAAWVCFAVEDTGIGIPPDQQPFIFDSFVQAEASTRRRFGGWGLGTTIASRLVKLMGGELKLSSAPGKGSRFWFQIPLQPLPEAEPGEARTPAASPDRAIGPREHVLVVEDYPVNQLVTREHLERARYRVTIVENGEQAVERFPEERFDLVLMDLQMPVMDGFEATRKLREAMDDRRVPILAMTASADAQVEQQCRECGMDDVILKPIHRDEFLETVARWLTGGPLAEKSPLRPPARLPRAFDQGKLLDLFRGDRELAQSMVLCFLKATGDQLLFMREQLTRGELTAVGREAHKIKGSAGCITANAVAAVAESLDTACRDGRLDEALALLIELEAEHQRLGQIVAGAITDQGGQRNADPCRG